jgi:hypothetical protein
MITPFSNGPSELKDEYQFYGLIGEGQVMAAVLACRNQSVVNDGRTAFYSPQLKK